VCRSRQVIATYNNPAVLPSAMLSPYQNHRDLTQCTGCASSPAHYMQGLRDAGQLNPHTCPSSTARTTDRGNGPTNWTPRFFNRCGNEGLARVPRPSIARHVFDMLRCVLATGLQNVRIYLVPTRQPSDNPMPLGFRQRPPTIPRQLKNRREIVAQ
jgi:hypothetical protein